MSTVTALEIRASGCDIPCPVTGRAAGAPRRKGLPALHLGVASAALGRHLSVPLGAAARPASVAFEHHSLCGLGIWSFLSWSPRTAALAPAGPVDAHDLHYPEVRYLTHAG
jgi:hypothetical protein